MADAGPEPAFRPGNSKSRPSSGRASPVVWLKLMSRKRPWNGHPRHLERDIGGVTDDLRADLDQFLLGRRERPFLDRLRRRSVRRRLPRRVIF